MKNQPTITILYVDDEEMNLFLFNASFKKKYRIVTASSGVEGLKKLADYKDEIIVVISDFRMPKMDGLEFIENAKKSHFNIAYFILTAYAYDERIDQALKANVIQRFFSKPYDAKQLESAIDEAAQQFLSSKQV